MSALNRKLRVAIVQARPAFMDLPKTLAKTISFMEEGARKGAALVCFGETWLPGYPAWLDYCPEAGLWNHAPVKEIFKDLRVNSVAVPGPATERISEAAPRCGIAVVVAIHERV